MTALNFLVNIKFTVLLYVFFCCCLCSFLPHRIIFFHPFNLFSYSPHLSSMNHQTVLLERGIRGWALKGNVSNLLFTCSPTAEWGSVCWAEPGDLPFCCQCRPENPARLTLWRVTQANGDLCKVNEGLTEGRVLERGVELLTGVVPRGC